MLCPECYEPLYTIQGLCFDRDGIRNAAWCERCKVVWATLSHGLSMQYVLQKPPQKVNRSRTATERGVPPNTECWVFGEKAQGSVFGYDPDLRCWEIPRGGTYAARRYVTNRFLPTAWKVTTEP